MTRPLALPEHAILSPSAVVDMLLKAGIRISERELRAKARRLGCYREIGRAMFFLPADLERIMEPDTCSPSQGDTRARTGTRAARSTVSELSEARAKLRSLRRGNDSRR